MVDASLNWDFVDNKRGALYPMNSRGNPGHGTGTASVVASRVSGVMAGGATAPGSGSAQAGPDLFAGGGWRNGRLRHRHVILSEHDDDAARDQASPQPSEGNQQTVSGRGRCRTCRGAPFTVPWRHADASAAGGAVAPVVRGDDRPPPHERFCWPAASTLPEVEPHTPPHAAVPRLAGMVMAQSPAIAR
jgi:hypothetical protein